MLFKKEKYLIKEEICLRKRKIFKLVSKLHSDNALEAVAGKVAVLTFQKKENAMIFFKRGRALNEKVCHGN